ncbi:MAG: NAD(P)-dependent oxidoreductase [Promethearchaeota archaeon]|jgi:3-hydroxyisobutyrate dehydrogenase
MFETIGFIGIGAMGTPMTKRLIKAGYNVIAHDNNPNAMKRAEELGASTAASPREIAERCNLIITMLPKSDDVEKVVLGPSGIIEGVKEGSILIDMTTAYPLSTKKIAEELRKKGVRMLDAPVSGGVVGAENGTLSIMVGGDVDLVERFEQLFKIMGRKIVHMGEIGSGHTMKSVNNFLSGCSVTATSEALALATKAGLSPKKVIEVLQVSSGRSWASDFKFPNYVLPRTFDDGFRLELLEKDLQIFTKLAQDLKAPAFIANTVMQIVSLASSQGYSERGHTSVAEFIEQLAGVKIEN